MPIWPTVTAPLVAPSGTITCAWVPSTEAVVGRTTAQPAWPWLSSVGKMTSVSVDRLVPTTVTAWATLAEAMPAEEGTPSAAVEPIEMIVGRVSAGSGAERSAGSVIRDTTPS